MLNYSITKGYHINRLQRWCKSINKKTWKLCTNFSIKTTTKESPSFLLKKRSQRKLTGSLRVCYSKDMSPTLAMIREHQYPIDKSLHSNTLINTQFGFSSFKHCFYFSQWTVASVFQIQKVKTLSFSTSTGLRLPLWLFQIPVSTTLGLISSCRLMGGVTAVRVSLVGLFRCGFSRAFTVIDWLFPPKNSSSDQSSWGT